MEVERNFPFILNLETRRSKQHAQPALTPEKEPPNDRSIRSRLAHIAGLDMEQKKTTTALVNN
jgi:hypothetical protein